MPCSAEMARTRWIGWLALGAFMLNRENARLLYPVVLGWLWLFFRPVPARARAAWLVVFTLGVAAAVVPVGLRNLAVGGEFRMSTSQAGPNFYIGNRPGASGSYEPPVPGRGNAAFEQEDATRLAQAALGRKLSAGEVSGYWLGRAADGIRQAPGRWLALLGRKTLLTINAAEVVDTESIEAYREFSPLLRIPLNFGVILALGAAGAWVTHREWRHLALLYGVALAFLLSVALFYVVARYRYPVVPVVLLLAGAAAARGRPAESVTWLERAAAGDLPDAISHYREALRVRLDYAEAHSNLALALRESGNTCRPPPSSNPGTPPSPSTCWRSTPNRAIATRRRAWPGPRARSALPTRATPRRRGRSTRPSGNAAPPAAASHDPRRRVIGARWSSSPEPRGRTSGRRGRGGGRRRS